MTTKMRTLSVIAVAAITLGVGIATVDGQGRGPGGPGRAFGRGPGGPGGPMPMLRQLNLTDAQKDQVKALVEAHRKDADQAPGRKFMELQRSLETALLADTPDVNQIDQLRASIAEAEASMLAARVDLQLKIAQILTPDQRKQARDLIAQRATSQARFNFGGRRRDRHASPAGQE